MTEGKGFDLEMGKSRPRFVGHAKTAVIATRSAHPCGEGVLPDEAIWDSPQSKIASGKERPRNDRSIRKKGGEPFRKITHHQAE